MKTNRQDGRNHKEIKKNFITRIQQTRAESGLNKQLLGNYQTENLCNSKQLEAEVKNGVAYKNNV